MRIGIDHDESQQHERRPGKDHQECFVGDSGFLFPSVKSDQPPGGQSGNFPEYVQED